MFGKERVMKKIAVINITSFGREFPEHINELEEKVGPVEKMSISTEETGKNLANLLEGFTYVLLGNYPMFDENFFANNKSVKLIARHGIGYNNVDTESANRHGVVVTRINNEVENDAVAEQAVALLMSTSKKVLKGNEKTHQGQWNKDRQELMGFQIREKTVGVIGCGSIGRRFSEIMHYGFKCNILICDPYLQKKEIHFAYKQCTLEELVKNADFISIHCFLNEETENMIGEKELAMMKKKTILINTARGSIVNEDDVYKALKDNKLFAYGADVSAIEPMRETHPLLTLDNVLITPHSAIYNDTCMYNMNRKVMEDIYSLEAGEEPFMQIK